MDATEQVPEGTIPLTKSAANTVKSFGSRAPQQPQDRAVPVPDIFDDVEVEWTNNRDQYTAEEFEDFVKNSKINVNRQRKETISEYFTRTGKPKKTQKVKRQDPNADASQEQTTI